MRWKRLRGPWIWLLDAFYYHSDGLGRPSITSERVGCFLVSYWTLARVFSSGRPAFLEALRCSAELATVAFVVSCSQLLGLQKARVRKAVQSLYSRQHRTSPTPPHVADEQHQKHISNIGRGRQCSASTASSTPPPQRADEQTSSTVKEMAEQPKKVKLVDFSAASAFYGSRKGYVFKTGDQGLGYYLDDVGKAKERVLEGLEGPGLFARAPCVDVEAPETVKAPVPAPAAEPPKKKKRFDPFADLPPPKKKAAPLKKPPSPEPEEKAPVKVFTSGLFKLEQVHCLHIVRKHKDARNPTSWRHPGRRIDRTRQDATDELEKMRTKLLAGLCSVSFGLRASRRWRLASITSRRWRLRGLGRGLRGQSSVGSRLRSGLGRSRLDAPAWAWTPSARDTTRHRRESAPHAYSETPHTRERHRHHTPSTQKTPHATQRRRTGAARSSRSSPRSSRSAARRRRAATWACSGGAR